MEGINLISSTYSDDEEDDETQQIDENEKNNINNIIANDDNLSEKNDEIELISQKLIQNNKPTIVDYGHDEVTMSPETAQHEREVVASGAVMIQTQLEITNGNESTLVSTTRILSTETHTTTTIQEQLDGSEFQAMDFAMEEPESTEVDVPVKDPADATSDDDLVAKFLPPPPEVGCTYEQQERIKKFLELKRRGKSYNAEVRNKKEYRNPDFLRHAVTYQDIDEIGSCFRKEVFDPHGYDKSDFYEEIEADMKRDNERKEQERKKKQAVEFVTGGTQSGVGGPSPRINIPIPAAPTPTAGGLRSVSAAADSTNRDGRNRKSKWDKVDGDQTTGGNHAMLLTAANAGSGYTAFAQQRRRETEEKKYIERKIDRRL